MYVEISFCGGVFPGKPELNYTTHFEKNKINWYENRTS